MSWLRSGHLERRLRHAGCSIPQPIHWSLKGEFHDDVVSASNRSGHIRLLQGAASKKSTNAGPFVRARSCRRSPLASGDGKTGTTTNWFAPWASGGSFGLSARPEHELGFSVELYRVLGHARADDSRTRFSLFRRTRQTAGSNLLVLTPSLTSSRSRRS